MFPDPEKPIKRPDWITIKKQPKFHPVFLTGSGNGISFRVIMAFWQHHFSSLSLAHPDPGNPAGMRI